MLKKLNGAHITSVMIAFISIGMLYYYIIPYSKFLEGSIHIMLLILTSWSLHATYKSDPGYVNDNFTIL